MNTGTIQEFEPKTRFRLLSFDEIRVDTGRDYLVKGLLGKQSLAVAWGPHSSGKSFWTYDLAMHIASGWPYRDHRVHQACVVYVAAEGGGRFSRRVEAFRMEKMIEDAEAPPFHLITQSLDLGGDFEELAQDIRAQVGNDDPGLVIMDTLNRTLRGSESVDQDMDRYARGAEYIRDTFGCTVLVVHHCGHDQNRMRGHSSLPAAIDTEFAVTRSGEHRTVEVKKQRDGEEGELIHFTLKKVEVAEDEDGDVITSCVVEPADAPATAHSGADKLNERQQAVLNVLRQEGGNAGLTTEDWNAKVRESEIRISRQALYNTRVKLKDKRLVHQDQLGKWHITAR